ncbi:MAG TPA: alpha-hydroxy acid oxidase [Candidatus Limnocylindrales bacterium]|nr:alpha-hydroxy acid oxidase [Candidatus Limnocylindrales bacterium]
MATSREREASVVPLVNVDELEARARAVLGRTTYDYIAGGAEDEVTMRANREAFARHRFRYHTLTGVANPELGLELLGSRLRTPVQIAPTATQRLAHPDGELAVSRAAASAGALYCLSTLATTSLEDVAQASSGHRWFQLYLYRDRGLSGELVDRAIAAGYRAIVLTVDAPILGRRERDLRNGFTLHSDMSYANLRGTLAGTGSAVPGASGLERYFDSAMEDRLAYPDLEWLVARSSVPVVVKGLVRGDDARRCIDLGARGIIVSNHGGRQLDHAVASLDALPEVVAAVGDRVPVCLDGGVRRGTDVLKAIALGARAVFLGRPALFALAVGGEDGVRRLLKLLADEVATAMVLLGVCDLGQLTADLLDAASRSD